MTPRNHLTDLDWTALRHALGELLDEEARVFEDRLGVDQSAREALARAVARLERLHEAALLVEPPALSRVGLNGSGMPGVRLLAIAASILLVVGWVWWNTRTNSDDWALAPSGSIGPPEIALAWADLRAEGLQAGFPSTPNLESLVATNGEHEGGQLVDDLMLENSEDVQESLPSWMVEATLLDESSESTPIEEGA